MYERLEDVLNTTTPSAGRPEIETFLGALGVGPSAPRLDKPIRPSDNDWTDWTRERSDGL